MIVIQLNELDLMESWQEAGTRHDWQVQFPLAGKADVTSFGSVYFEIEPGQALPTHVDSQDEIVILLSGSGEGTVGNRTVPVAAHGMVFIPSGVAHSFHNTGSETMRAIGIFAGAAVVSTFEHEVMPTGMRSFDLQAVPTEA